MNSFIHSLISYKEIEEKITPKLLELNGFKDFLYKAAGTFLSSSLLQALRALGQE